MDGLSLLLIGVVAYLVGSTPVARLLSNCRRSSQGEASPIPCLAKVLIDIGKGLAVVTYGCLDGAPLGLIALFGVFLGHMYPVWRSSGGHGLGTLLGGLLALDPQLGLAALAGWMCGFYIYRNAASAALIGAAGTLIAASILPLPFASAALMPIAALVYWRHRDHWVRAFRLDAGGPEAGEPEVGRTA